MDTNKKEIVFEYGVKPEKPDVPVTPSIHERVAALEATNAEQDALLAELVML